MDHLVVGATFFLIPLAAWYVWRGRRTTPLGLAVAPMLMAAGALWAVAPDIPRVLGRYALYARIHEDPRLGVFLNVFFFHHALDQTNAEDSPLYLAVFFLMALALLAAAWRELAAREGERRGNEVDGVAD